MASGRYLGHSLDDKVLDKGLTLKRPPDEPGYVEHLKRNLVAADPGSDRPDALLARCHHCLGPCCDNFVDLAFRNLGG